MSNKSFGYIIIILVVIAVVIGATGYFLGKNSTQLPKDTQPPATTQEATERSQTPAIRDCGFNFDCIIGAARTCERARARLSGTVNLFGLVQTGTTLYETRGYIGELCILYLKVERAESRYSDELVQQLLNTGQSLEQIRQQEQQVKQASAATVGKDGTCQFEVERLVSLLRKWKSGSFSGGVTIDPVSGKQQEATGDFAGANCQGSYFSN